MPEQLEERVAYLEAEVARLKNSFRFGERLIGGHDGQT